MFDHGQTSFRVQFVTCGDLWFAAFALKTEQVSGVGCQEAKNLFSFL